MGVDALRHLGFRGYQALRAARIFRQHESRITAQRFEMLDEDEEAYASQIRSHLTELDELIQQDDRDFIARVDHAWEPSPPTTRGA